MLQLEKSQKVMIHSKNQLTFFILAPILCHSFETFSFYLANIYYPVFIATFEMVGHYLYHYKEEIHRNFVT